MRTSLAMTLDPRCLYCSTVLKYVSPGMCSQIVAIPGKGSDQRIFQSLAGRNQGYPSVANKKNRSRGYILLLRPRFSAEWRIRGAQQGFPTILHFAQDVGINFSPILRKQKNRFRGYFLLLRQGSNLNFTDPESVVLPITPRSRIYGHKDSKNKKK